MHFVVDFVYSGSMCVHGLMILTFSFFIVLPFDQMRLDSLESRERWKNVNVSAVFFFLLSHLTPFKIIRFDLSTTGTLWCKCIGSIIIRFQPFVVSCIFFAPKRLQFDRKAHRQYYTHSRISPEDWNEHKHLIVCVANKNWTNSFETDHQISKVDTNTNTKELRTRPRSETSEVKIAKTTSATKQKLKC